MKVKINKTGEIKAVNHDKILVHFSDGTTKAYNSIRDICDDLEDYEEPKEYWHMAELCGGLQRKQDTDNGEDRFNKAIGNYFETEEEAEKAVEKLKAWKRLKDKGFEFTDWSARRGELYFKVPLSFFPDDHCITAETRNDLDLLFGSKE